MSQTKLYKVFDPEKGERRRTCLLDLPPEESLPESLADDANLLAIVSGKYISCGFSELLASMPLPANLPVWILLVAHIWIPKAVEQIVASSRSGTTPTGN